jgi:hypothetical protein
MGDDPMAEVLAAFQAALDHAIAPLANATADLATQMQRDAARIGGKISEIGAGFQLPSPDPPLPSKALNSPSQHATAFAPVQFNPVVKPMPDSTPQHPQEHSSIPQSNSPPPARIASPKAVMMSRKQAAGYLGFESVKQLDNLLHAGLGPPRVKVRRSVYFKITDLDDWIEAHRHVAK